MTLLQAIQRVHALAETHRACSRLSLAPACLPVR
jgi:hypothetical protein